jgi:hypothetical protein
MSDSATAIRYNTRETNDSGNKTWNRDQYTTEPITRRNQPAKENPPKKNKQTPKQRGKKTQRRERLSSEKQERLVSP